MIALRNPYLAALIVAFVLVVLSTVLLTKVFVSLTEVTVIFGTFASIFAFFATAYQLAQGYEERARDSVGPVKQRRLLAYSLFSMLGLCASVMFIVAVVSLVQLLSSKGTLAAAQWSEVVIFRVLLPLLATALFLVLDFKVRAVRMLDSQKAALRDIGRILNDWHLPDGQLGQLSDEAQPSPELVRSYGRFLEAICEKALSIASATGHQSRSPGGLTSVLFLADIDNRCFVPVAVAGGTTNYRNALDSFRPPFFDRESFRDIYNRFHRRVVSEKIRKDQLPLVLNQFRKESAGCISSTGLIYSVERKLSFNDNLYSKCIAFRFEFLDQLPMEEREAFQFRQLVGVPVGVFGRKVGVLLLMSSRPSAFYTNDKVFRLMGDMVGVAVQFGIFCRLLDRYGLGELYQRAPRFKAAEELEDVIHFVNGISHNFSRPC